MTNKGTPVLTNAKVELYGLANGKLHYDGRPLEDRTILAPLRAVELAAMLHVAWNAGRQQAAVDHQRVAAVAAAANRINRLDARQQRQAAQIADRLASLERMAVAERTAKEKP